MNPAVHIVETTAILGCLKVLLPRLAALGVKLFIDHENEDYYIETAPEFSEVAVGSALGLAWVAGLEAMPRSECLPEHLPDGSLRVYLAERAA